VKFSETTTEAIQREIAEETGEHLEEIELFSVIENFFLEEESQTNYHEFLFIYKGQIEEREIYNGIDNSHHIVHLVNKD